MKVEVHDEIKSAAIVSIIKIQHVMPTTLWMRADEVGVYGSLSQPCHDNGHGPTQL